MAYRLMLWSYKVSDRLGIDKPELHLKDAPLKAGMTVVDWGCGPGRYAAPLSKRVGKKGRVYALDIEPAAIRVVQERIAGQSLTNVEALLIDPYRAPLPEASADLVLLLDAFHDVGDPAALLREIHRVLKPEGRLFMDPGHMKASTAMERIEATGLFTLVEQRGSHILLAPVWGAADRRIRASSATAGPGRKPRNTRNMRKR